MRSTKGNHSPLQMGDNKIPTNISMPPTAWGPLFWNTIHIVTLGYPADPSAADKDGTRKFFESLKTVIPCPVCREHYKQHLAESPVEPALEDKGKLIHWGWDLHNRVNDMLGKPTITIEQFLENMVKLGATKGGCKNTIDAGSIACATASGIALGAIGYYVYQKYIK
jgi:hypothetical protein